MHARCPISAGFGHYSLPCQASFLQDPGDPSDHLRSRSLFHPRMRSLSQDSFILGETCTDTGAHHTSNSLNSPCEWKRCWLRYHTRYWTSPLWKLIPVDSLWPLKFLDIQLRKIRKQVLFFIFYSVLKPQKRHMSCISFFIKIWVLSIVLHTSSASGISLCLHFSKMTEYMHTRITGSDNGNGVATQSWKKWYSDKI